MARFAPRHFHMNGGAGKWAGMLADESDVQGSSDGYNLYCCCVARSVKMASALYEGGTASLAADIGSESSHIYSPDD